MRPDFYHQHHTNYVEDLPLWLTLADEANGQVLELGCGTGRVLLALRGEGIPIYGLDNDPSMLSYLKQLSSRAAVFLADLTRFHLGRTFPLIILPCNTYSTLTSGQRVQALERVAAHLPSGGKFVASLPNPADLIEMGDSDEADPEESFIHDPTGAPVQVSSSWQTTGNTVTIYWHYDMLLDDGQVVRTTHYTTHQRDPIALYLEELAQAGFSVETLGEFDGMPYHPEADFLIVVATLPR